MFSDSPLPVEVVRDLLSIARLLHRAREQAGDSPEQLAVIQSIGDSLQVALQLASRCSPGTMGMTAAWSRAEDATEDLGRLLGDELALDLLLSAKTKLLRVRTG